jgi:hypothetical protein
MGYRFRRSIKILPGIRLNLGKKSASVTVGGRGAHVTLRPGHKTRATVSLQGTGLSYTQGGNAVRRHEPDREARQPQEVKWAGWLLAMIVLVIIIDVVMYSS